MQGRVISSMLCDVFMRILSGVRMISRKKELPTINLG
jgi:hypothetical protein